MSADGTGLDGYYYVAITQFLSFYCDHGFSTFIKSDAFLFFLFPFPSNLPRYFLLTPPKSLPPTNIKFIIISLSRGLTLKPRNHNSGKKNLYTSKCALTVCCLIFNLSSCKFFRRFFFGVRNSSTSGFSPLLKPDYLKIAIPYKLGE